MTKFSAVVSVTGFDEPHVIKIERNASSYIEALAIVEMTLDTLRMQIRAEEEALRLKQARSR